MVAIVTILPGCCISLDPPPVAPDVKVPPLIVALLILRFEKETNIAGNVRCCGTGWHSEDIISGLVTLVWFVPVYRVRCALVIPSHPDVVTFVFLLIIVRSLGKTIPGGSFGSGGSVLVAVAFALAGESHAGKACNC